TWRCGWVFRNEKPGPGRFRQFMQLDADSIGAPGVQSDAEMCMMMADALEAVGIPRGSYAVRVSNRKVLDGDMAALGIEDSQQKLTVLRAFDKLDKFPVEEIVKLLGPGRLDESGDFTKGAGLDDGQIARLVALTGASDGVAGLRDAFADSPLLQEACDELEAVRRICAACGYGDDRIRIDPSVVRGLEYYTGIVYEAELLAEIPNDKGEIVRFGSVGGGGRYDGLIRRFTGQDVPATGFSIGVSRLMAALRNLGKLGA